ncbi:hypothetical protein [Priestia aryabhattai]|nr:hypothetical protein [Priestia aryabhattai]
MKKYIEANNSSHKKDKSKTKDKSALQKISSGLTKQQVERMAKHSK